MPGVAESVTLIIDMRGFDYESAPLDIFKEGLSKVLLVMKSRAHSILVLSSGKRFREVW